MVVALHGMQKGKEARFPTLSPHHMILHAIAGENYTNQKIEKGIDSQFRREGKRHSQQSQFNIEPQGKTTAIFGKCHIVKENIVNNAWRRLQPTFSEGTTAVFSS